MDTAASGISFGSLLSVFLPRDTPIVLPALPGQRPPYKLQCRQGRHDWLNPELSLRSARTGFTVEFCRYCSAHQRLVPERPARPAIFTPLSLQPAL